VPRIYPLKEYFLKRERNLLNKILNFMAIELINAKISILNIKFSYKIFKIKEGGSEESKML